MLSPLIDVPLEALNQMILELDPTFQLRPPEPGITSAGQATSQARKPQEAEAGGIKYAEVTSPRPRCHEATPRSDPTATPLCHSPRRTGLLLSRENLTTNGSVIFSGSQSGPTLHNPPPRPPPTGTVPPIRQPTSPGIAIPGPGRQEASSRGSGSLLAASPGFEHVLRAQQRASGASVLSSSPGSDTSYSLGSPQTVLPSGSPGLQALRCSLSSLPSLRIRPGSFGIPTPETLTPSPAPASGPSPLPKAHASSCPPSIANSMMDIPVVLVNGCLEPGAASPQRIQLHLSPSGTPAHLSGSSKASSDTSLSGGTDGPSREAQPTMKFVMDTSKYWFKPSISRDQAIELLRSEELGTFVIRDSTSYRGSFGLAMKVPEPAPPPVSQSRKEEESGDQIRHFLIESSARGVHLKGAGEEPYFGSLSAFVYQHAIMSLALPCKLAIPRKDFGSGEGTTTPPVDRGTVQLNRSAACNILYLNSVGVETLSGALAVRKAVSATLELETLPVPAAVHFKVTDQGITLTDIQRKVFFRRHYPLATLRFCGLDPEQRKWQKYCKAARIFGFVAKSQTDAAENVCHLFAERDPVQPASLVIDCVNSLLPDLEKM
ncbi:tensin-4 [Tachyglossus aculeatus]|uniref:tensin-4 n=1 Tax=Tachyglossus aculeatus TaxID=9261 RepID=UPI0018F54060|nr:tensin-4 [Tachyglossus aculeatus]